MGDPREHQLQGNRNSRAGADIRNVARRHPSVASSAAIAILLSGALLLAGELASASGRAGPNLQPSALDMPTTGASAATAVDVQTDTKQKGARASGLAVCVRLCDGYFFPSATSSDDDAACAVQCPDAPTARYTERGSSTGIDNAISTRGALYSALPVAHRYQNTLDSACRCHRSPIDGYSASSLNDPTLRKGDLVMTPNGFLVFQGAKTRSVRSSDFVALSQARAVPKELRAALVAEEHAGAP
jgi:hypothetical protein